MLISEQINTSRTLIRPLLEEENSDTYLKWVQAKKDNQSVMGMNEKYTEL
jgi:hypothetical protein